MKIIHKEIVESTNSELKGLLKNNNVQDWTILFADYQEKGRGQRGSVWEAEPKKNLLVSIYFRPIELMASEMFKLNEWVSVSILRTLESLAIDGVEIKWPNDILVKKNKISGILIENSISGSFVDESIIGIGLNVNSCPKDVNATSVSLELGINLSVKSILEKLISEMLSSLGEMREEYLIMHNLYLRSLHGYQKEIVYSEKGIKKTGHVIDVDTSGKVLIESQGKPISYGFKEIKWELTS